MDGDIRHLHRAVRDLLELLSEEERMRRHLVAPDFPDSEILHKLAAVVAEFLGDLTGVAMGGRSESVSQSMLFLKCERDAYAARFVKTAKQRAELEWEILDSAFDYLQTPRQTRDPDLVREMYEAVGEFREIGDLPVVKTARAIFAATVLEILDEERLRAEDSAYRPDAVEHAFADAVRAGIAAFDAQHGEDYPGREKMQGISPGVKDRLAWQAAMAWQYGRLNEAVRAFPEPAFGNEKMPSTRPVFLPVEGILMNELWAGLLPPDPKREWTKLALSMSEDASETDAAMETGFLPAEIAGPMPLSELRVYEPPNKGDGDCVEVSLISVKGRMEGVDGPVAIMELPQLPKGHSANQPNTVVKVWDWCPWRDCVAAEAWISLENDVTIYAVAPYYCQDKFFIDRGLPCTAQIAFFPVEARLDTLDGESRIVGEHDGEKFVMSKDFTYLVFASKNDWLSHAWYASRALIEDVRMAKMWNGEEVWRLELRMRDIPFAVPTYVHPANFTGGMPKVGDAVIVIGWFYVDLRRAQMSSEEYKRLYPEGLSVPKDKVPGSLESLGGNGMD